MSILDLNMLETLRFSPRGHYITCDRCGYRYAEEWTQYDPPIYLGVGAVVTGYNVRECRRCLALPHDHREGTDGEGI
jgi:hypothetical protein